MKRIAFLALLLCAPVMSSLHAQDAATEERLNKLSGQIEDIISSQQAITRRIEALAHELETLKTQVDKPAGNFASDEDLKRLADSVKEIDRKRLEDYQKIGTELKNLGRTLAVSSPAATPSRHLKPVAETTAPENPNVPDKRFEYTVKKGDTLSIIVQAYRDNNIKVTTDQVLKANPGLKPERLRVGQKIVIPAPTA